LGVEIYPFARFSTITGDVHAWGHHPIQERTGKLLKVISWLAIPAGGRNNGLAGHGGRLRYAGMGRTGIEAELMRINDAACVPPLESAEVQQIAESVSRYDVSGFLCIPRSVLHSEEWHSLDPGEKALLIDIAARFTGNNNGRLTAPYVAMHMGLRRRFGSG
jgi:hypothetical protein